MAINLNTEANAVDKKIIAYLTRIGLSDSDFDTNFTIKGKDRPDVAIKNKESKYCIIFENKKDFKDLYGAKGQGLSYLHQLQEESLLTEKILLIRTNMVTFHADEYGVQKGDIIWIKDITNIDILEDLTLDMIRSYTSPVKQEETKLLSTDKQELKKAFDVINNFLRDKGLGIDQRLHITMAILFLKLIKENTDLLESISQSSEKKDLLDELENIKVTISEKNIINVFDAINKVYNKEFRFDLEQYKGRTVLLELFDIVDRIHLSNYDLDIKGEAFEYFINYGNTSSDMGEYFTPRHIVRFMVKLLDQTFDYNREKLSDKTYFDPTCGTGGFLIEIFKQVREELRRSKNLNPETEEKLKTATVFGNELNLRSSEIAKMNMILTGDGHSNIDQGDFLILKEERKNCYDVTIGNPPFGGNKEWTFVDGFLKDVKVSGYSIFLVPEGVLFKSDKNFVEIRKTLLTKGKLLKVISLPQGVFLPYAGVKTDIIFWKNELQIQDYDIEFIDIKNDGYTLDANRRPRTSSDLEDYFGDKQKLIDNGQVWAVNSSQIYDKTKLNELEITKSKINYEEKDLINKINIIKKQIKVISSNEEKQLKEERLIELQNEVKEKEIFSKKLTDKLKGFDLNLVVGRYKAFHKVGTDIKLMNLGDIAEITNGFPFSAEGFNKEKLGIPVIRIQNLDNGIGPNTVYRNQDFDKKYLIYNGDILVSLSGSFKVEERQYGEGLLNQRIIKIKFNENIINKKLGIYFLKAKIEEISSKATQTSVGNVSINDIKNLEIPVPCLEYQQEILNEIESYQKIIDGAKQIIFGYKPRIKVKKECEVTTLGNQELFEIESGGTPDSTKEDYWNGNINRATLVDLPQDDYITFIDNTERKITEDGVKNSSAKLLPPKTIIVSSRATIGRVGIAMKKITTNQGYKNIIIKNFGVINEIYLAYVLKSMKTEILSLASGGTFPEISKSNFSTIKIPLPSIQEQQKIIEELEEEQKLVDANKKIIEIFEQKIKAKIDQIWSGE